LNAGHSIEPRMDGLMPVFRVGRAVRLWGLGGGGGVREPPGGVKRACGGNDGMDGMDEMDGDLCWVWCGNPVVSRERWGDGLWAGRVIPVVSRCSTTGYKPAPLARCEFVGCEVPVVSLVPSSTTGWGPSSLRDGCSALSGLGIVWGGHPGRCPGLSYCASLRLACAERLVGRAGRRAPHAERAVILPAVQSLRRAGSEGIF
jgi:hypothetical protein